MTKKCQSMMRLGLVNVAHLILFKLAQLIYALSKILRYLQKKIENKFI